MKRLLLFAIFLSFMMSAALRAQSIPNASFENWTQDTIYGFGGPVVFEHPVDWYPLSSLFNAVFGGNINIFQSTIHYGAGSSGLMIEADLDSIGADVYAAFPISSSHQKLYGYYKYEGAPNTFANVFVAFTRYDAINDSSILLAQGASSLNITNAFTQFEVPIINTTATGTPDSAFIMIEYLNGAPGSKIYLDALSFDASAGVANISNKISIDMYPVPMENELFVSWEANTGKEYKLSLMSITGQMVWEGTDATGKIRIPADDLNRGTYMLRITDGQSVTTRKVVK